MPHSGKVLTSLRLASDVWSTAMQELLTWAESFGDSAGRFCVMNMPALHLCSDIVTMRIAGLRSREQLAQLQAYAVSAGSRLAACNVSLALTLELHHRGCFADLSPSWPFCRSTPFASADHMPIYVQGICARSFVLLDAELNKISELPHLEFLECAHRSYISDSGWGVLSKLPQLKHLSLSGMTDSAVAIIAPNGIQLRSLDLSNCGEITDDAVTAVATHCTQLLSLKLRNCTMLTDISASAIASNCQQLKELDLWNCNRISGSALQAFAKSCQSIQKLNLGKCTRVTDAAIRALAEYTQLQELNVTLCEDLTDAGMIGHWVDLQSFVAPFTKISDTSVEHIAKRSPLLHTINLSRCRRITDSSLHTIAAHCKRLHTLDVAESVVTDSGVVAIATSCREMQVLNFELCRGYRCWCSVSCSTLLWHAHFGSGES